MVDIFCAGAGFSFDYAAIAPTPVPPTLLLFATDLGALGVLGPAQEEERRSLISFGVVGCCTSVRVFGKFPLKNQWRIHQRNFRQQIRVFGKFPLMSQWRIPQRYFQQGCCLFLLERYLFRLSVLLHH